MKLCTFDQGQGPQLGVIAEDKVIPVTPGLTMIQLIADWSARRVEVEAALASGAGLDLASVSLKAPVLRPGKVFAIGLNYADHVKESGMEMPKEQVWFTKAVTSVNGPYEPVQIPVVSQFVDYEVELVAVIGKGGRRIPKEQALEHVFGYCVGNDLTERMWQHRTPQWSLGKSFDTHAPIGPWITTTDEVTDPHCLDIRCWVNGEERQSSNTEHLVFDLCQQIEQLSGAMTLEPGDLIFTGTPGGIGAAMNPRQFLKAGDVVRCEIATLGAIENSFQPEV
jgi:2-keto-4-pentenoate hydratase/2-oxohepta-3-ene-1,7-dioic acid hydratase in catechol pathway